MADNKKQVRAALEKSINNITSTLLPLFDAKAQQASQSAASPAAQEEHSSVLQDAQKKLTAAANALQKYSAACLFILPTNSESMHHKNWSTNQAKQANSCSGV